MSHYNQSVPNFQSANMTAHRHRHSSGHHGYATNGHAPSPNPMAAPVGQPVVPPPLQSHRPINRRPVGQSPLQQYPAPRTPTTPTVSQFGSIQERMFREANRSGTGWLSERELGLALHNSDSTKFDPATVRMLFRMFSQLDPQGQRIMSLANFTDMYDYLNKWRGLYMEFDADRSGKISVDEFRTALGSFGFTLSDGFVNSMFRIFEARAVQRAVAAGMGYEAARNPGIGFDLFMQAVATLKRVTDSFKQYDTDRDGYIMLSFEDFVSEVFSLLD
ncbi:hypothetical protein KEM56_006909 [Ascosphaera pollenicola]|nr:hypothetical protein KEM56_006909 [Ascosphaera pollenicola]